MGGGASSKKKAVNNFREQKRAAQSKGGVALNKRPWDAAKHGPNPDKAAFADVIACLTEYYQKHNEQKVKRVCGEVGWLGGWVGAWLGGQVLAVRLVSVIAKLFVPWRVMSGGDSDE